MGDVRAADARSTPPADSDTGGNTIRGADVCLRACPAGPLLVRGADSVVDTTGVEHAVTRPVVAVCLCRKSSRGPWCDGTHKSIPNYGGRR